MSDSYTSSDENAEELPLEYDLELNKKLAQAVKGEGLNKDDDDDEDNDEDEPHHAKGLTKEEEMKLLQENEDVLKQIADADPKDEADSFLKDFFGKRKWEEKASKNMPTQEDVEQDDDLEEIDQGIEFEKKYNFRHEEKGFEVIPTNPRFVEGEDRVKETNRHKKRREAAEQAKIDDAEVQRRLDVIDEKYKKIADENNGKLTNEQLHEYTNECADVYIEQQDGVFQYTEVKYDGGIEKSIKILDDPNDHEEEEEIGDEEDNDAGSKGKNDRKNQRGGGNNNSFRRNDNQRGGSRGGSRGGFRGGRFGGNRGGGHDRRGGSRDSRGGRESTYNLHRH